MHSQKSPPQQVKLFFSFLSVILQTFLPVVRFFSFSFDIWKVGSRTVEQGGTQETRNSNLARQKNTTSLNRLTHVQLLTLLV